MGLSVPLVKMLMFHIGLLLQNWTFEQKKGLFFNFPGTPLWLDWIIRAFAESRASSAIDPVIQLQYVSYRPILPWLIYYHTVLDMHKMSSATGQCIVVLYLTCAVVDCVIDWLHIY